MSVSRDFIDPCSPPTPPAPTLRRSDADSPPWAEWPKPPRSVPEQCLVFGFHISSPVQGVDIPVQDILIQDWLRLPCRCRAAPAAAMEARSASPDPRDPGKADLVG